MKLRRFRGLLVMVNLLVMALVLTDVLLHVTDPWGAFAYGDDLNQVWLHTESDTLRRYRLVAGAYTFSTWQMTILPDHTRRVPGTAETDCTVAVLGDSVTMGHGVSDGDTFTAQLAAAFGTVRFINAGVEAYNAEQIALTRQMVRAEGYLYLLIGNDADVRTVPHYVPPDGYRSGIALYWIIFQQQRGMMTGLVQDVPAFDAAITALKVDPTVTVIGIEGDPLAARAEVETIPVWTQVNSFADPHPNAVGHREIAAALMPLVEALIQRRCL